MSRTAPPASRKLRIELPRPAARLDVEADRRLVEEEGTGSPRERERQREPPTLSSGEPAGQPVGQGGEPELVEQVGCGGGAGEVRPHELDQLADTGHGREARLLRRDADLPAGRDELRVAPEELRPPAIGPPQPERDLDRAGLAGTVRPEQRHELAGPQFERDSVEGDDRAEVASDVLESQDWCRCTAGQGYGGRGARRPPSIGRRSGRRNCPKWTVLGWCVPDGQRGGDQRVVDPVGAHRGREAGPEGERREAAAGDEMNRGQATLHGRVHGGEAHRDGDGGANTVERGCGHGQQDPPPDSLLVEGAQRDVARACGRASVERGARYLSREPEEEREPDAPSGEGGRPPAVAVRGGEAEQESRARRGEPERMPSDEPEPVQGTSVWPTGIT